MSFPLLEQKPLISLRRTVVDQYQFEEPHWILTFAEKSWLRMFFISKSAFEQFVRRKYFQCNINSFFYCFKNLCFFFLKFPLSKILSDLCCLWAISFFSKKYFLCKILNDLCRSESLLRGHSNFQIPSLNNLRLVQKKPGGGECLMWKNILGITDFLCMATKIFYERPEMPMESSCCL